MGLCEATLNPLPFCPFALNLNPNPNPNPNPKPSPNPNQPTDPEPSWTDDGYEMSVGVNHLGHFLLVQLLLPELKRARGARCCIVGSVTGNSNTIAGSLVKPVATLTPISLTLSLTLTSHSAHGEKSSGPSVPPPPLARA